MATKRKNLLHPWVVGRRHVPKWTDFRIGAKSGYRILSHHKSQDAAARMSQSGDLIVRLSARQRETCILGTILER